MPVPRRRFFSNIFFQSSSHGESPRTRALGVGSHGNACSFCLSQRLFPAGCQGEERVNAASSAVPGALGIRSGTGVVRRWREGVRLSWPRRRDGVSQCAKRHDKESVHTTKLCTHRRHVAHARVYTLQQIGWSTKSNKHGQCGGKRSRRITVLYAC